MFLMHDQECELGAFPSVRMRQINTQTQGSNVRSKHGKKPGCLDLLLGRFVCVRSYKTTLLDREMLIGDTDA